MFTTTLIKLSGPISFYIQAAKFNRCCDDLDHDRGVHLFGRSFHLELSLQLPVGIVFYATRRFLERV